MAELIMNYTRVANEKHTAIKTEIERFESQLLREAELLKERVGSVHSEEECWEEHKVRLEAIKSEYL